MRRHKTGVLPSVLSLASDATVEREFRSLMSIGDNYPKYVLSMDTVDMSRDGVIHRNIVDWLLGR